MDQEVELTGRRIGRGQYTLYLLTPKAHHTDPDRGSSELEVLLDGLGPSEPQGGHTQGLYRRVHHYSW